MSRRGASLRSLLRLAGPLAIADVATMMGGVATTMMMGRIDALAMGVQGLGSVLFFNCAVAGFDVLMGLDYPIAHAVGAGRLREANAYFVQGLWLSLATAAVLGSGMWLAVPLLEHWDLDPAIVQPTIRYVRVLSVGLLPVLVWVACRRYLQARGRTQAVMVVLLVSLVVELAAKATLIFGLFGAPRLGAIGAAAGAVIEFFFVGGLGLLLAVSEARAAAPASLAPDRGRLLELLRHGAPAGLRSLIEIGFIATVTILAARVGAVALAAHQIALNVASLTFMVPLGLSAGIAVQVGHALGARDFADARRAGWTGIGAAAAFMIVAAVVLVGAPHAVVRAYTTDPAVGAVGVHLLAYAAAFQLFDGVQVAATGALRGSGDTRTPVAANLLAHWVIGLPLGWVLCFRRDWGVEGLWLGLAIGLVLVGSALVGVWARRARQLEAVARASDARLDAA